MFTIDYQKSLYCNFYIDLFAENVSVRVFIRQHNDLSYNERINVEGNNFSNKVLLSIGIIAPCTWSLPVLKLELKRHHRLDSNDSEEYLSICFHLHTLKQESIH